MTARLDCLVIGYNDPPMAFQEHRIMSGATDSPERRVFMREHLLVDGERLACMDVINRFAAPALGGQPYFHVGEVPNLAAAYLSSFLRRRGFESEAVSMFRPEKDRLADLLEHRHPRAVVITTTFYLMPWPVHEISEFVAERSPDSVVIVGGPLIDNMTRDLAPASLKEVFRWMGGDVYVRESQGETTLAAIVGALRAGRELAGVPNIYLRDGDTFHFTRVAPENNDLDECAIDWDLFRPDELGCTVQTRTARSCAFKCSFCDFPVRAGRLSVASVDTVERELRQLARHGVRHLVFVDDTFNVPITRFKELCRMMIRNDFGFRWYSFFRCSAAKDSETYDLMAASGCQAVFLGIESGDETVLRNMVKTSTLDQYRRGIENLHARGIGTIPAVICGFINQNAPTFFRAELWFYNHRSPIRREADAFQIRGHGYDWQHATMDVGQAADAADRVFSDVTGSIWMPGYNYDFWAVPYLLGKGLTLDQIKEFHVIVRRLMRYNAAQPADRTAAAGQARDVAGLADFFGRVRLAPPRYQAPAVSPVQEPLAAVSRH
jgi:p-methyltransferase